MNRSTRRKLDKKAKQKFTPEQYKDFTAEVQLQYVKDETEKMSKRVIQDIVDILPIVLRANRISEDRTGKILTDFSIEFKKRYKEVFWDEGLPE